MRHTTSCHAGETLSSGSRVRCRSASPINGATSASSHCSRQSSASVTIIDIGRQNQSVTGSRQAHLVSDIRNSDNTGVTSIHQNRCYVLTGCTQIIGLLVPSSGCASQISSRSTSIRGDHQFGGLSQNQTFTDTGTNGVVLIGRQSNRSQNTDDRYNDHQLDQSEAFFELSCVSPLI